MKNKNLFGEYEEIFETENTEGGSDIKEKRDKVFAFSPFALQDALGEKSAKRAWIEYEKLRFVGIEAEELVYKMTSKIKDMAAIMMGAGKDDLGLKDYPYNKSKRDLKNWQEEELKNFYTKLVEVYHRSRMGFDELDVALEKIILNI